MTNLSSIAPRSLNEGPILFVVEVADNMKGGMARQFRFVGEAIARKGYTVDYLFLENMPPALTRHLTGFTLDVCRRALIGLVRYLKSRETPSLILWSINSAFPFTALRRKWSRVANTPLVGMTFGVEERWWPQLVADARSTNGPRLPWHQYFTTGWLRMRVLDAATRACDHVVCVSSEDRRYLVNEGLPSERVTVIPVGVDPGFLVSPVRQGDGTRILFVGTWIWRKGVKFLVEALSRVLRSERACTLSVVGVFQEPEVVLSDWPSELRPRIRVVPELDGTEMVKEYVDHDIFVLPSLFEGMPLSLAEAMAAQMGVVTTATCGMIDLVNHRQNGLIVPPRDSGALAEAILELVRHPGLRLKLGACARNTISLNTWDHVANQFLEVFARATQKARRL